MTFRLSSGMVSADRSVYFRTRVLNLFAASLNLITFYGHKAHQVVWAEDEQLVCDPGFHFPFILSFPCRSLYPWGRPDQQLSFLQVGRRVNPSRFDSTYRTYRFWYATSGAIPISYDVLDDRRSYFKFNLDTINLYNLIRLEDSSFYRGIYLNSYRILRRTTDDHGNAHFNMIDRGLQGPNSARDAETRKLLEDWLRRPRRDEWVDWRGVYPACGMDQACAPIRVVDRVRTDFLWQRSPFLLYGGGAGTIEGPGIDYILPYWMARYYGVL